MTTPNSTIAIAAITMEFLSQNRGELVDAMRAGARLEAATANEARVTEAAATARREGGDAAVAAERTRIAALIGAVQPGHELQFLAALRDGTTAEAFMASVLARQTASRTAALGAIQGAETTLLNGGAPGANPTPAGAGGDDATATALFKDAVNSVKESGARLW